MITAHPGTAEGTIAVSSIPTHPGAEEGTITTKPGAYIPGVLLG